MSELQKALLEARSSPDILGALGKLLWAAATDGEDCPDHKIPTPKAMTEWMRDGWAGDVAQEAISRAIVCAEIVDTWINDPKPEPVETPEAKEANGLVTAVLLRLASRTAQQSDELRPWFHLNKTHKLWTLAHAIAEAKNLNMAQHPIAPIVRAWQLKPVAVEPDMRLDSRILPHMSDSARRESLKNSDRALAIIAGKHEKAVQLELFPEPEPHEVALLNLVDGTGQPIRTSGQGAPLVSRLLVSTVLAIPQEARCYGEVQFDLTLRDLVDAVYAGNWRRGEQWPDLREALRELRDIHIRERQHSTLWQVVNVRRIPDENAKFDSPIRFEAALPPGSTTGPMINPMALAEAGKRSSPAWRAYIAAHSLAWIPGVTRVPAGKGNRYGWTKDVNKYPVLTDKDRKRLAFGDATGARSKDKLNAPWQDIPGLVTLTDQRDPKTGVTGWRFIPESVSNRRGK